MRSVVGRQVKTLALFQPLVEQLADGHAKAVRARGRLLVDEVADRGVGVPCAAVEGLGYLPGLAGQGVFAHVDPDLPHALLLLSLRPLHCEGFYTILGTELGTMG